MPVAALAAFCRLVEPKLIVLSLTTVPTPNKAADFVTELRAQLPNHALIVAGGAAAQAHALLFEQAHITVLDSVFELERHLPPLLTSYGSAR